MRVITRKVKSYRCSVCKTDYSNRRDAAECEAKLVEVKKFRVGDLVANVRARICPQATKKPYFFRGRVVKIWGPVAMDDFEAACRQIRNDAHFYQYEVAYRYPRCEMDKFALYYAYEFKPAK